MHEDHVPLSHVPLRPGSSYNRGSRLPRVLHPDDPALPLMTDFSHLVPVTTGAATRIACRGNLCRPGSLGSMRFASKMWPHLGGILFHS